MNDPRKEWADSAGERLAEISNGDSAAISALLAEHGIHEGERYQDSEGEVIRFYSNGVDPDTNELTGWLVTNRGERIFLRLSLAE